MATPAATPATSTTSDASVQTVIAKKIRALKKKLKRIISTEKSLSEGKTLDAGQLVLISSKSAVEANIAELNNRQTISSSSSTTGQSASPPPPTVQASIISSSFHSVGLNVNGYAAEDNGDVVILSKGTLTYVKIECPDNELDNLHTILRNLSAAYDWFPSVIPPSEFPDVGNILVFQSNGKKGLSKLDLEWFYEMYPAYNSSEQQWEQEPKPYYPSLSYKRLILSMLKTIVVFHSKNLRPVFDLGKMFISPNGHILFTKYVISNGKHQADEMAGLLKLILSLKVIGFDVPVVEMDAFCTWLTTTRRTQLGTLEEDAFQQVVFWSPLMRIDYIRELFDSVQGGLILRPISSDALTVRNNHDWIDVIIRSNNPTLLDVIDVGNKDYRKKHVIHLNHGGPEPSIYRTDCFRKYWREGELRCGLTRIRDAECHIRRYQREFAANYKYKSITREQLQTVFQNVFPKYMVEFAKLQSRTQFDAKNYVLQLFQASTLPASGGWLDDEA